MQQPVKAMKPASASEEVQAADSPANAPGSFAGAELEAGAIAALGQLRGGSKCRRGAWDPRDYRWLLRSLAIDALQALLHQKCC